MHKKLSARPVFLTLWKIHLPLTGFVSITHRVSGVLFFLAFPALLYLYSLVPLGNELNELMACGWVRLGLWCVVNLYLYHFFAGIRHMVMDFTHHHSLMMANLSAKLVLGLGILGGIITGVLLW